MLKLHESIKEATKASHQALEGTVVRALKAIRSEADYAGILKKFYAYFQAVEQAIAPHITPDVLPDYAERRNSRYLRADIEALGGDLAQLPHAEAPQVNNSLEAMSALYVLEGSIMGGAYIVKMLASYGLTKGTSFFCGYGEESGSMWAIFTDALNRVGADPSTHQHAAAVANETFCRFGKVFA